MCTYDFVILGTSVNYRGIVTFQVEILFGLVFLIDIFNVVGLFLLSQIYWSFASVFLAAI